MRAIIVYQRHVLLALPWWRWYLFQNICTEDRLWQIFCKASTMRSPSLLSIWGQNMDFIVWLMDHLSFREFSQTKYPHICKNHKSANHSSWWDLCQRKIWMIYCSIHWKQDFKVINLSIMIHYNICHISLGTNFQLKILRLRITSF